VPSFRSVGEVALSLGVLAWGVTASSKSLRKWLTEHGLEPEDAKVLAFMYQIVNPPATAIEGALQGVAHLWEVSRSRNP
jgi:hypothetical protein